MIDLRVKRPIFDINFKIYMISMLYIGFKPIFMINLWLF
jgi:hypothetical protein